MDFTFCLLSEQQQLLLPLEIDFALGLVLRGYLMNFGYLGKGTKDRPPLEVKIKMSACISLLYLWLCFPWAFTKTTWKKERARGRQGGATKATKKPQQLILTLYRLYSPNKSLHVHMMEKKQCYKRWGYCWGATPRCPEQWIPKVWVLPISNTEQRARHPKL